MFSSLRKTHDVAAASSTTTDLQDSTKLGLQDETRQAINASFFSLLPTQLALQSTLTMSGEADHLFPMLNDMVAIACSDAINAYLKKLADTKLRIEQTIQIFVRMCVLVKRALASSDQLPGTNLYIRMVDDVDPDMMEKAELMMKCDVATQQSRTMDQVQVPVADVIRQCFTMIAATSGNPTCNHALVTSMLKMLQESGFAGARLAVSGDVTHTMTQSFKFASVDRIVQKFGPEGATTLSIDICIPF